MAVYLKQFSTTAEYDSYISGRGVILPNVSICDDTPNEVHYNPYVPYDPYNGHEYVEIGGLKWATMNVGAEKVTDFGLYFQWGDTQGYTTAQIGYTSQGKKYFGWETYKYSDNGTTAMTKYNSTDGLTSLEASDDAAIANWGGSWRMPTADDFEALLSATTSQWVTQYDGINVKGMLFTDKNDSSKVLFFPAIGAAMSGTIGDLDTCRFWTSSLNESNVQYGMYFHAEDYGGKGVANSMKRCYGTPIRAVVD